MPSSKIYSRIVLPGIFLLLFLFVKCKTNGNTINVSSEFLSPVQLENDLEKVELGRKLFFDKRLSLDNTVSCATCHVPEFAFTDRKRLSVGIYDSLTMRNSPSLLNSVFLKTVMYDAHLTSLEMQVIVPIQEHNEMGMKMQDLIKRLSTIEEYREAAKKLYNRDFDPFVLTRSISAFERSLISDNSRFDQYYSGKNKKAINKDELAGWKLFSEKLYCTQCHAAPNFTNFVAENNGLYSEYGLDKGRFRIFNDSSDIGKFKVPSLRNIELTYPYMHDGSLSSLDQVIDHYSRGGQNHKLQNKAIKPFVLSSKERMQLKKFLFSLTDTSYMKNFR